MAHFFRCFYRRIERRPRVATTTGHPKEDCLRLSPALDFSGMLVFPRGQTCSLLCCAVYSLAIQVLRSVCDLPADSSPIFPIF